MAKIPFLLTIVIYGDVIVSCAHTQGTMDDLVRLRQKLFRNYTKDFRPVYNLSETTHVTIEMFLMSIIDLNTVSGTITLNCQIMATWTDDHLVWNPSNFNGVSFLVLNSSNVWKPRIYITTSSDDLSDFSYDAFDVRVYQNGTVVSTPGRHVKATCRFDMTNFPTDSQKCSLQFASYFYMSSELSFVISRSDINMLYYRPNGEWIIDKTSVTNNIDFGTDFSLVAISIHLTRRSEFFFISMIIPVLLLCLLNPFVFLLPTSSGERISYTLTIFLSLAVYMTLIGENIPKVSNPMAGVSYLLLVAMLNSCAQILMTIFTLRCDVAVDVHTFPGWFLRLTYRVRYRTRGNDKTTRDINIGSNGRTVTCEGRTEDGHENMADGPDKNPQMEDVTRFIDQCLFCIALSATIMTASVFVFYYWL